MNLAYGRGAAATSAAVTSESTGTNRFARKSRISAFDHVTNSASKHPPITDVST
jgi:hypothetical protein